MRIVHAPIIAGLLLVLIIAGAIVLLMWLEKDGVNISTASPGGSYRVDIKGETTPKHSLPVEFYVEDVRLEAYKGEERVTADNDFYHGDPFEASFLQAYPEYEWLNDSTLRLSARAANRSLKDELTILNSTGENLELLEISYGKFERYLIFDVAPRAQINLRAVTEFEHPWPVYGFSYTAYFKGSVLRGSSNEIENRKVADGPVKFVADIRK